MQVSEMKGGELDSWVAKAELQHQQFQDIKVDPATGVCYVMRFTGCYDSYSPSTNWLEGGVLIEREHIQLLWLGGTCWQANVAGRGSLVQGETPLLAAMRAYVILMHPFQ